MVRWRAQLAPALRAWWHDHDRSILLFAVACVVLAAVWRLGNEVPRLLWEVGGYGAFDLRLRHHEVHTWFAGGEVYGEVGRGDYPPASYVILWPLVGWLELAHARVLWALATIASLAWFALIAVRAGEPTTRPQVLLLALLPFSTYAASAAIRVGQIGNLVLPLLLSGLLLLHQQRGRWWEDLLAGAMLLPTLVKVTLTAPFFWLVCFVPGRARPIVLVTLGYIALTIFAISFQEGELRTVLLGWTSEPPQVLTGHANVHKWLAAAGAEAWALPASIVILFGFAAWVYRHRRADFWILAGVAALVARLFIHHRLYDDMLILVPMITLFRLARGGPDRAGSDVAAGVLFAATWVTLLAPASFLTVPYLSVLMDAGQSAVWLAALAFLGGMAGRHRQDVGPATAPAAHQSPGDDALRPERDATRRS
jgi:hypothetical protein